MFLLARGVTGHRVNRGFDGLPEIVLEKARHPGRGLACALARQGQGVAGEVTRVDQPGEERIQNQNACRWLAGESDPANGRPEGSARVTLRPVMTQRRAGCGSARNRR
jgi:hypothetical protein